VSAYEITLELLAKTALGLKRLAKYRDVDEQELISDAYSFLLDCDRVLDQRNYSRSHNGGGYTQWATAVQEITGSKKRSKRLADFFIENPHWLKKMYNGVADIQDGLSPEVTEEDFQSPEWIEHLHVRTSYIPEIKADFASWNARKNREQGRENKVAKKSLK
jgi:hypothetical protein